MTDGLDFTEALVAFITDDGLERAASGHFAQATRGLIDTVAVMLAGADSPATAVALESLATLGTGRGSVAGSARTLPLLDAILVNAVAAHALDFDDTIQGMTTHPSCHLVPALLGLASHYQRTGPELLTSYLVGLQVEYALAEAFGRQPYSRGWHTTGTAGAVATAAATARLLRLPARDVLAALAAAASAASGLRANFGSMVKPLHAGRAARAGTESALLAGNGLTASRDPLSHRFGLFAALGADDGAVSVPSDLDRFPVLRQLAFKPYPCCGEAMGAVEAAISLHQLAPAAVPEKLEVRIGPFAREVLEFDRPRTADEARFSVTYCVATALRSGALKTGDFSEAAVTAAAADNLGHNIAVIVDAGLGDDRAATVTATFDGQSLTERVTVPRGDPRIGFSDADVRAKFAACAAGKLAADPAATVVDELFALGLARQVGDLIAALR